MLQLREFTESDLALAEAWLHKAHVRKWYEIPQLGVTLEDWMMAKRKISMDHTSHCYVARRTDWSMSVLQGYR